VLYQLLTGKPPHAAAEGRSDDPAPPSRVNPALPRDVDFILGKALRKEPEERYVSVDAFADDVGAFLALRPIRARSGSAWYRTRKLLRRHWLPASAIAAAMAFLSAGIYVANRERIVAQHRFSQLRQLADKLLHLDSDLYALPGSSKVRLQVVAASMEYLDGLGREARTDRALSLDVANGYVTLAESQGVPSSPNLGLYEEADRSLRKAEDFAESAGASAGNTEALLAAAEANQDRMIIADTVHRRADALAQAQKCAARVEAVIRDPAVSKDQLRRASRLLGNVGIAYMNMHRYDAAVRYARRVVELARSTAAPPDYLIGGMGVLANALRQAGDLDGALQSIAEARILAEASTFPSETAKTSVMYAVLYRQGMILGEHDSISLNRPAEAAMAFQEAFDVVERQASRDPNDTTSRDRVATAGRELGAVLVETDAPRALAVYDHSLMRLRELKRGAQGQRDEARTLAGSSYALRKLGRVREAGDRIDAALALLRSTKDLPASQVTPGDEVEVSLRAQADQEAVTGRQERALEMYRNLLGEVMASKPDAENDLQNANALSRIYVAIEGLERVTGRREEAASMNVRRMDLWRAWNRKLPGNSYVLRQLALQ
jgi:tetratricopeptide (TPR) repeat protein